MLFQKGVLAANRELAHPPDGRWGCKEDHLSFPADVSGEAGLLFFKKGRSKCFVIVCERAQARWEMRREP